MSTASWLEPLYDAAQMRATDAWAIGERGVPSLELMERAGAGVAEEAARIAPQGSVAILVGKGNNGGDGLVAARLLRGRGREAAVLFAGDPGELTGDARANLERLPGAAPQPVAVAALDGHALIVDALLGTGATGEPRGAIADAIRAIGTSTAPVLAVDVPSGVDASTGEVAGLAVRAQVTVTFHAAKPGLWIEPGRGHAGRVVVLDIGIPQGAPVQPRAGLIRDAIIAEIPRRGVHSTKFTSGRVLVAGGSPGLTGAPCLAALAAARAGAGYVTVCVPSSLSAIVAARLLEQMTLALPDERGEHTAAGAAVVADSARERGGALVLGPGLGRGEHAAAFARGALERAAVPIVLDADGLRSFGGDPEALGGRADVITPHEGELGRLLDRPSAEIAAARLRHVREAAARAGAVIVLKGDDTIVAQPDGLVAISPGATPGLATAGTGDVLAGVIGAMLAAGLDAFTAAAAGVRLHALAAIHAAGLRGVHGMIASDVIESLPAVRGVSVRAIARVNLAAIERNCTRLAAISPALCAVVKADAYGHGAIACARAALAGGAAWLAVAAAAEACELRDAGIEAPILVMGALSRDELERALAAGADVVAWHEEFVDWLRGHDGARVHVKLDTGMGRLGTRDGALADRLAELVAAAPELELVGAMTHLATAEHADGTFMGEQLDRFAAWVEPLRERHPQLLVHGENSAALLGAGRARFDMARAGGAVYGLDPFGVDPAAHGLEAALALHSWVAARKPLAAGESAGYGRTFVAREATELAVIPVGYGDGFRRVLSNNADVLIGGRRRPLVGTVSMDNVTVELGRDSGVAVGALAILLGSDGAERISAEEIAGRQGTINYEITCAISPRVPRSYHRDGA